MNAQEILDRWYETTADEDRKEVYEVLMAVPEFGRFLVILKEFQAASLRAAGYVGTSEEMYRYHGSAQAIDEILEDIRTRLSDTSAVM